MGLSPCLKFVIGGTLTILSWANPVTAFFRKSKKLRHSLGRPSRSDFVQFQFVKENGKITSSQVETLLEVKQRRARSILSGMVDLGILERQGSYRRTTYVLKDEFRNRELEYGMKSR